MKKRRLALMFGFVCAASAAVADPVAEDALRLLLQGGDVPSDLFAPAFLEAVPEAQLDAILQDLSATIGPVQSVAVSEDAFRVQSASHSMTGKIALTGEGRIAMLFFEPPVPNFASLAAVVAQFDDLGDQVAWLIQRDGTVLSAEGADQPLAVASAFKLAVMAVLVQDITQGTRDWADVVGLKAAHISLPTGRLRLLPAGAPLTLHTAAAMMIADSDNTATDLLLDVLGRERVARRLGVDQVLSTREFFALKADPAARDRYISAIGADKAAIAAAAAENPLPSIADVMDAYNPGLEWEVPLTTLCDLIEEVAHIPLMSINAGAVDAGAWSSFAFKGGSETGVMNLTAAMRDASDRLICLALTVNDAKSLEAAKIVGTFRAAGQVLAEQP